MQVKYVQASNEGVAALPKECRANYVNPGPNPAQCLTEPSDIQQLLGYSQQRQAVQGIRFDIQSTPYFCFEQDSKATKSDSKTASAKDDMAPNLKQLLKPVLAAAAGMLPKQFQAQHPTIEDIGEGVGLLWMTEDWSDTPHMPSGVKFHTGLTPSSSSIVLSNADLQLGLVMLANFPGTDSIGFDPIDSLGFRPWSLWWCGAAQWGNLC